MRWFGTSGPLQLRGKLQRLRRVLLAMLRELWAKLGRLHLADYAVLVQASFLVLTVRLALRLLPFRVVDRGLGWLARRGRHCGEASARPDSPPAERGIDASEYEQRAAWAVGAVARRLLRKRPCLTQALVLRLLLERRGLSATLQIGVRRGRDGTFDAHAWLERDGCVLIGGDEARRIYPNSMTLEASPEA